MVKVLKRCGSYVHNFTVLTKRELLSHGESWNIPRVFAQTGTC